ncbi:Galactose/methyl galactoside import ATP-binding protein MglA [Marinomonas spartinae]|uniref:Galactose/methyl galactoside import ATP-binding protein MglA n=1 Tax=Marinomonas spartinae TaxID=1792290 RepID=A0A1A8TI74_9GAMM|nr:ABC transporter ATP-binding protein [Marinomonas spartinae]SBS32108.1 Galactose/methyl galactoside import ATP-binding protein MglA [Marinomonas spartinae]SBS35493.1 Galactose/methyl galactoside import ATP-binding protein MglA [Marinomonas spartinae]
MNNTKTAQHISPRLELINISKQYPGCLANDNISLSLMPGEIHALLGENGAGKSTLVKTIYGVVAPDTGQLIWDGKEIEIKSPSTARELGIGMVFQHFSLFETLTVSQNIELCLSKPQLASIGNLAEKIRQLSQEYGLNIDPHRYVHSLSIGERQRVEIMRCLVQSVKLLILDEPTSVLTPQEVSGLFSVLRTLAKEGCSILFISHKLHEVTEICEKATILRGGKVINTCSPADETSHSIAKMMVGDLAEQDAGYSKKEGTEVRFQIHDLSLSTQHPFGTSLKHINLELKAGEILGIAGVAGNGQDELMAIISGEDSRPVNAHLTMKNQPIGNLKTATRRQFGMAYVPEERLGRGAVPDMSLTENTLLTHSQGFIKYGLVQWKQLKDYAKQLISDYSVKCHGEFSEAKSLSGGNLQKFIMGREIGQRPDVLICAHPTWGVDVGAALAIHQALLELRDQGAAILLISEDIDELFLLADRMAAVCDGYLSPIVRTQDTNIDQIGQWMAGTFINNQQHDADMLQETTA